MTSKKPPAGESPIAANSEPVKGSVVVAALTCTIVAALAYALLFYWLPSFERLFAGFGADLPKLTSLIFSTYRGYGLLILLGLIPTLVLMDARGRHLPSEKFWLAMAWTCAGIATLIFFVSIYATYLPILKMGAIAAD